MNDNFGGRKPSLRERLASFMYGRNGIDQLYHFLFWTIVALSFLNIFLKEWVLTVIELLILIYALFRVFSRNVYRRQKENQVYLVCLGKIRSFFGGIKRKFSSKMALENNKWRDRKTHVYKRCPKCKNILRLPKVKGKHTAACPCCGNRFDVRII
ncbi:MAG: hypothetical protein IJW61_02895 [Clostridia bacterium]|nr:hypothetical protein [Clostridia bacterium]